MVVLLPPNHIKSKFLSVDCAFALQNDTAERSLCPPHNIQIPCQNVVPPLLRDKATPHPTPHRHPAKSLYSPYKVGGITY